ncbi:hypothetical protein T484DRAFT_2016764, partial [Baffinella frigidus]
MAFDGLRSEADLWLGADDTADVLAGKAGEANERLRLAAATVEQEVLVCAAALCGKPSLPPSALEFELSSHLATLQGSSRVPAAADPLEEAAAFLREAEACEMRKDLPGAAAALADARTALGLSHAAGGSGGGQTGTESIDSLPGATEESVGTLAADCSQRTERIERALTIEMHRALASPETGDAPGDELLGVKSFAASGGSFGGSFGMGGASGERAVTGLCSLLPVEKVASLHGEALGQILEGVLAGDAPGGSDASVAHAQAVLVCAGGRVGRLFAPHCPQSQWDRVLREAILLPTHRAMAAVILRLGAARAALTLIQASHALTLAVRLSSESS